MENLSKVKLSIRRVLPTMLPGEDVTLANVKVGASLKGTSPLRGLTYKEEAKYLPEIINYATTDVDWRKATRDYWNNISVPIPADGVTAEELQGKILEFILSFKTKTGKEEFETALEFDEKVKVLMREEENGNLDVVSGVSHYVLFRYCMVYGRVANSFKDIGKSPKIRFYLYSKQNETRYAHKSFKIRSQANAKFTSILEDEKIINALLLLFKQDLSLFKSLEDKHLALESFVTKQPQQFLNYIKDSSLLIKALIKKAVSQGVINNPDNTDSYYYGENNEILLGTTLTNAVLYFKSTEESNLEIIKAIKAQVNNN